MKTSKAARTGRARQPVELPGREPERAGPHLTPGDGPDQQQRDRLSRRAEFIRARAKHRYFGRVYFQRGSRPHMTISVAERGAGRGVVVAVIDLSFVSGRHRPGARRNDWICIRRRYTRLPHYSSDHQPRSPAHELRQASAGSSSAPGVSERVRRLRPGTTRMGRRCSAPSRRSKATPLARLRRGAAE